MLDELLVTKKRLTFTMQTLHEVIKMADCLEEIYYLCCGENCYDNCDNCDVDETECIYKFKMKIIDIFKSILK